MAFRRLLILAYIIFSSLWIINSLGFAVILPSLWLSPLHKHFSLLLSGGVICQMVCAAHQRVAVSSPISFYLLEARLAFVVETLGPITIAFGATGTSLWKYVTKYI